MAKQIGLVGFGAKSVNKPPRGCFMWKPKVKRYLFVRDRPQ